MAWNRKPFASRKGSRREDTIADAACASGRALVMVHSQQAAWSRAESGTEGGYRSGEQDKDGTAAEDDFRGHRGEFNANRAHTGVKNRMQGANGQARPHSLQSEVGLEACRS